MAITKKGNKWEIVHSLWIIWSFIWLLNGIGMFLAGKKVRVQKWYRFGLIYTAIGWISGIVISEKRGIISDIMVFVLLGIYITCIIHCFSIRKEYLIRLEIIEEQKMEEFTTRELQYKIAKEYGVNSNKENYNFNNVERNNNDDSTIKKENISEVSRLEKLIDVNSCTEDKLLQLPGIGVIEAKKVINFRNDNEFNSVDEFIEFLNIKPHFVEKIRSMLVCNKTKNNESRYTTTNHPGRMVDF